MKRKWLFLLLASLLVSLAVPLALGGRSQFELLHRLSWGVTFLLIFFKLVSWAFNALRSQFLLGFMGKEVGFREAALITASAEFAGVATPGAVGMAATYAFLFHRLGLNLGTAAGLVGVIVVTDLAVYGAIMPLAALVQMLQGAATQQVYRLVALSLLMVAGGAYLFWALVRHYRRVCFYVGLQMTRSPWLARRRWRLGRATVEFLRAIRLLRRMSWSQRLALFLISLDFWVPRYLILVVVLDMVDQYVPNVYLLLVQAVLHVGGQALGLPGGAGLEEGGYAAFMTPFMDTGAIAFTLLVWRFFSFYWYLIVGGPIFIYKAGKATWDLLGKES